MWFMHVRVRVRVRVHVQSAPRHATPRHARHATPRALHTCLDRASACAACIRPTAAEASLISSSSSEMERRASTSMHKTRFLPTQRARISAPPRAPTLNLTSLHLIRRPPWSGSVSLSFHCASAVPHPGCLEVARCLSHFIAPHPGRLEAARRHSSTLRAAVARQRPRS